MLPCRREACIVRSWSDFFWLLNYFRALRKFMGTNCLIFGYFALSKLIYFLNIIFIKQYVQAPGPGAILSAHSLGNFNFGLIVTSLIFYLSFWRVYWPGPGFFDLLKIEIEEQFSRLSPMDKPCLGFLLNSDCKVYLSGDGEILLLNITYFTCQFILYVHIQKMVLFCQASITSNKNEN